MHFLFLTRNPILISTSADLKALAAELKDLTSYKSLDTNLEHLNAGSKKLSGIKSRLKVVIATFEKENTQLSGKIGGVGGWFIRGELKRLGLQRDAVMRDVERAGRNIEWRKRELMGGGIFGG